MTFFRDDGTKLSMNTLPLISIIINVHNGMEFVEQAIESAYNQTYSNFEIVLYDNASTDGIEQIIDKYDTKLKYFQSDDFISLGKARNNAIRHSNGEFFCFLDCDDLMHNQKLEKQVPAFKDPDVGLVYSNSIFFWEKDGKESVLYSNRPSEGMVFKELFTDYFLSLETVMIRKSALENDEKWWFPENFSMCEEADLFIRIAYKYKVVYVNETLAKYRIHDKNWTSRLMNEMVTERRQMVSRLCEFVPEFKSSYKKEINYFEGGTLQYESLNLWRQGKRMKSMLLMLKSFFKQWNKNRLITALIIPLMNYDQFQNFKKKLGHV